MTPTLNGLFLGVFVLLGVGMYGLLVTRHLIKLVVVLQILGKAAALALVVAGHLAGQPDLGQSLALTAIVADTLVAVLGLALGVRMRQRLGTLDVGALASLKG